MATQQAKSKPKSEKVRTSLGIVILALGVLVFLPKFMAVVPHLEENVQEISLDLYNALPTIGLGVLHMGQALAFEPASFFARALHILVSFWPLLLVAAGTILLWSTFNGQRQPLVARVVFEDEEGRS